MSYEKIDLAVESFDIPCLRSFPLNTVFTIRLAQAQTLR